MINKKDQQIVSILDKRNRKYIPKQYIQSTMLNLAIIARLDNISDIYGAFDNFKYS